MNETKTTAKDFFMHLAAVVFLYSSAVSLINLLFQIVNYAFPDNLEYYVDPYSSAMRWAIATLVIMFPLYLILLRGIEHDVQREPAKKQIWIRRWLSFLTLFVAGLTVAIDLVVLINNFLGGELTARFGLKVLAVLIVAAAVFGFYIYDLRRDTGQSAKGMRSFSIGAIALVLISLVSGFIVMGSPAAARKMKFDDQRIANLSEIQWQVVSFWQRTQKLPTNLDALNDQISGFAAQKDPETGASYEYAATDKLAFRLCAIFDLASTQTRAGQTYPAPYDTNGLNNNWQHGAGRVCFDRTIDPSRYPPTSNNGIPVKSVQ